MRDAGGGGELARGHFSFRSGGEGGPEQAVVGVASDLISDLGSDGGRQSVEVLSCQRGFGGDGFVQIVDVGVVVLVVVDAHGFRVDVRFERAVCVGEGAAKMARRPL